MHFIIVSIFFLHSCSSLLLFFSYHFFIVCLEQKLIETRTAMSVSLSPCQLINSCSRSQSTLLFNPLCSFQPQINLTTSQRSSHALLFSCNKKSRDLVVHAIPETGDLLSSAIPFLPSGENNNWVGWAMGLGVTVPLITARLLTLTKQVGAAAETVEKMADVVGKVADEVDKAAEDFKEKLPEGGALRGIVESIEHLAEETEKDAQLVEDLMDKVEEVDEKLEAFISNQLKVGSVKVVPNLSDVKKQ